MSVISHLLHWIEDALKRVNLTSTLKQAHGFSRLGFTKEEQASHEQFRQIAKSLDLHVYQDDAGNQWAVWKVDEGAGTIALGSHLDTVYKGGGYDGTVGVVAVFTAIHILKEMNFQPKKNIAVVSFICEESARFGLATIGSQAICGLLDTRKVATLKDKNGITLKEAVEQVGLDWRRFKNSKIPQNAIEQFIELHIEQGTHLENAQKEIGIVQAIAQATRLRITCTGMTNHTGTTPMYERQDALLAVAQLISCVDATAKKINTRQSIPLMATVSTIHNEPNAMNMIPGKVVVGVDIRSTKASLKQEIVKEIEAFTATFTNVSFNIEVLENADPIHLDSQIQQTFKELCKELDFSFITMDSGAGHDVMNMARRWPSGLLFIPCHRGISHHPKEHTTLQAILDGSRLLAAYLRKVS